MILQYLNKRRLISLFKSFFLADNNQSDDMLATTGEYLGGVEDYPNRAKIFSEGELTPFNEQKYFHNGEGDYPVVGDTVYENSSNPNSLLDGQSFYRRGAGIINAQEQDVLYTISSQGVVEDIKPVNVPLVLGTTGIIAEGEAHGPELLQDGGFDLNGSDVNLLTNGDFESGTTGWAVHAGSLNVVNGDLILNGADLVKQENILTVGTTYTVTFEVYDYVSGTGKAQCGQNDSFTFNSNGVFTQDVLCTDTPHFYIGRVVNGSISCKIKYVSVLEQGAGASSPWTGLYGLSTTDDISNSLVSLQTNGANVIGIEQDGILDPNQIKSYKVQIEVKNFDSNGGGGRVYIGNSYVDFRENGVKDFVLTRTGGIEFRIEGYKQLIDGVFVDASFDIEYASVKEIIPTLGNNSITDSEFNDPTQWTFDQNSNSYISNGKLTISQSAVLFDVEQKDVFDTSYSLYLIEVEVSRYVSGVLYIYATGGTNNSSQIAALNFERGASTYYLKLDINDDTDIWLRGMLSNITDGLPADFDIEKITARPIIDGTWTGPYELEFPASTSIGQKYNMVIDWGDGSQNYIDYVDWDGSLENITHQYAPTTENPDVKIYTYEKMGDGTDADNPLDFNKTNWNIHLKEIKQWGT